MDCVSQVSSRAYLLVLDKHNQSAMLGLFAGRHNLCMCIDMAVPFLKIGDIRLNPRNWQFGRLKNG